MAVEVLGLRLRLLFVVWRQLFGRADRAAADVRQRAHRLVEEVAVHGLFGERVSVLPNASPHVVPRAQQHLRSGHSRSSEWSGSLVTHQLCEQEDGEGHDESGAVRAAGAVQERDVLERGQIFVFEVERIGDLDGGHDHLLFRLLESTRQLGGRRASASATAVRVDLALVAAARRGAQVALGRLAFEQARRDDSSELNNVGRRELHGTIV